MNGSEKSSDKDARAERLAEALRKNLHRRKSQARQRKIVDKQDNAESQDKPDKA